LLENDRPGHWPRTLSKWFSSLSSRFQHFVAHGTSKNKDSDEDTLVDPEVVSMAADVDDDSDSDESESEDNEVIEDAAGYGPNGIEAQKEKSTVTDDSSESEDSVEVGAIRFQHFVAQGTSKSSKYVSNSITDTVQCGVE
jgi:hypothetical protein